MKDIKQRAIRGSLAKLSAQGANYVVRIGSLMVLARLLSPKDFGIVGMVTAFSGVLDMFRDFGLSAVTVQRADVTEDQISTLFWINILVGVLLGCLMMAVAPVAVAFYHEPRLFWVTIALGSSFVFNAVGVQHSALLQRQMRFTALATINFISLAVSTLVGIVLALAGFAYWALVASAVSFPLVGSCCMWITSGWVPGKPRTGVGLRHMMRFGGGITLSSLLVYVAYNFEKVLLGRFWGADAVGLYGRAYQLSNIPTSALNSAVGEVAFSALSRVRSDPPRFRNYFLKGYSLVLAFTIPLTIAVALFAPELISILLGPKWKEAAPIFRLLAPTILVFAVLNPTGWLVFSLGLIGRSVRVATVMAPLMIFAYVMGLPYGPKGVALAYSTVMVLWVVPHIAWGVHGTVVSLRDVALAASRPLVSGIVAGVVTFGAQYLWAQSLSALPRLILGTTVLLSAYVGMLFYVMGQKPMYLRLFRDILGLSSAEEKNLVPA